MEKLTDEDMYWITKAIDHFVLLRVDYRDTLIEKLKAATSVKGDYSGSSPEKLDSTYPFRAFDESGVVVTVIGYNKDVGWIIDNTRENSTDTHTFLRNIYL